MIDLIKQIENDYNVVVVLFTPEMDQRHIHNNGYSLRNEAFCAGREIYIGEYDNDEFKLFALFHELGHIITPHDELDSYRLCDYLNLAKWKTAIERAAWKHGISAAKKYDISFSYQAYRYAISRLRTYYSYKG